MLNIYLNRTEEKIGMRLFLVMKMMITKYPKLEEAIKESSQFIRDKKKFYLYESVTAPAAEVNNARIYNCCFLPMDNIASFSETIFTIRRYRCWLFSSKTSRSSTSCNNKTRKEKNLLSRRFYYGWAMLLKF
jgi:hypothetical protein